MFENSHCPSCRGKLPGGASYCAKCGYGTKDGNPKRVPFDWKLVASMLFLVPFAVCGGCIALGYAYDSPHKSVVETFAIIEYSSFGVGIFMILVNLVVSFWRNGK